MTTTVHRSIPPNIQAPFLLLMVLLIYIVVFLGWLNIGNLELHRGDEYQFYRLAQNLLQHGAFSFADKAPFTPTVARTPGYPLVLAAMLWVGGNSLFLVRSIQMGLLSITAWLIYLLGRRFFNHNSGLCAAILTMLYPVNVFTAIMLQTETLVTLLTVSFTLLSHSLTLRKNFSWSLALSVGLIAGAMTLVRPNFAALILFPFALMLAQWRPHERRRVLATLVIMSIGFWILVTPWLVRNAILTDRPFLIAAAKGWSLYVSAQQYAGEVSLRTLPDAEVILEEYNRRKVAANVALGLPPPPAESAGSLFAFRSESPAQELYIDQRYSHDASEKIKQLTAWTIIRKIPLRIAFQWGIGDLFVKERERMLPLLLSFQVILLCLAIPSVIKSSRSLLEQWPLWMVTTYLSGVHLFVHSEIRYTIPAWPFILAYAGFGISYLYTRLTKIRTNSTHI